MAVLELASYLLVGFLVCIVVLLKWNELRYRSKGLPPGTMGWPLFGETTEFIKYGPDFMRKQGARYGNFFKTHILGCPTVVCMDPEINRYILLNEAKGLVPGYPQSMLDILGKKNIAAVHNSLHRHIKGSMLSLIGPAIIKDQLLPKIDKSIRYFLSNWEGKTIDIQDKAIELAFLVAFELVFETESKFTYNKFKSEFHKIVEGSLSLPLNIPGTSYHSGFQGRKSVIKMLKEIVKERWASQVDHNDLLAHLLRTDTKYPLSDEEVFDQVITILYAGYETVSATLMMAIKYLHDNPKVLQQLKEEQFTIRQKKGPEDPITWEEYKSMKFTSAVIFETSRLASVVNGLLRKTTQDIELNGYIIPKGWRIYVFTRFSNYDTLQYPEPLIFNPYRWLEKSLESHNYCFIFGGGTRICPGKELGIVIISIFLHYFVTQYRYEEVGEVKMVKFPRVEAENGLHIRVSKY